MKAEVLFSPMSVEEKAQFVEDAAAGILETRSLPAPGKNLILPYFQVDTTDPFGETTLLSLRTVNLSTAANCSVTYKSVLGADQTIDLFVTVPGGGVWSRNLRDVPGLNTDPDGYKRGYATVACDSNVSGDTIQVNPAEDFATGTRIIDQNDLCVAWDIRFVGSAAFSGGTSFSMYHPSPGGIGASDPPTGAVTVLDEGGNIFGIVELKTNQNSIQFDLGVIIAALPGGIGPANGSFWVVMAPAGGGGFIQATFSAENRYSVGFTGSCQDLAAP
jgi:hypothetical protein